APRPAGLVCVLLVVSESTLPPVNHRSSGSPRNSRNDHFYVAGVSGEAKRSVSAGTETTPNGGLVGRHHAGSGSWDGTPHRVGWRCAAVLHAARVKYSTACAAPICRS